MPIGPMAAAAQAPCASEAFLHAAAGAASPAERDRLWPALSRLDWAMALPSSAAPGFVYLAGACGGIAVGGGGRAPLEALARLAGETSEVLAQTSPVEAGTGDAPEDPAIAALWGGGPRLAAWNVTRGRRVGAPVSSIFTEAAAVEGAPPRSLGLAAGRDRDAARLAGLLELIERDAAAAWWNGAARARGIDAGATAAAAADLGRMRAGAARPTAFLALPGASGTPVVCALSRDPAGAGLAFGFKAALDPIEAVAGAMCELLQMEIALEIARLRAAQGRAAPGDAGPLARAALDPDAHDAFAPLPPVAGAGLPAAGAAECFGALVARLGRSGIEVTVVDLAGLPGLPGGLAVAKVFAPGLRPLPGPGGAPAPGSPGALAALLG